MSGEFVFREPGRPIPEVCEAKIIILALLVACGVVVAYGAAEDPPSAALYMGLYALMMSTTAVIAYFEIRAHIRDVGSLVKMSSRGRELDIVMQGSPESKPEVDTVRLDGLSGLAIKTGSRYRTACVIFSPRGRPPKVVSVPFTRGLDRFFDKALAGAGLRYEKKGRRWLFGVTYKIIG